MSSFRYLRLVMVSTAMLVVVGLTCATAADAGSLLADVKADYKEGTTAGDTSATVNPVDTNGAGRWDYYQTDTFGSSGSESLLEWDGTQNPGSGTNGRYERSGVDHSGGGQYDFPQFSDHGGYGQTAAPSEVFVHPSDSGNSGGGTETKNLVRWTAGAGEAGTATISGTVRRPSTASSGGQMKVFVDGVEKYDSGVLAGNGLLFSFEADLSVGSEVDYVFDPAGSHNDDSMYLSTQVYKGTPDSSGTLKHRYSFSGDGTDSVGTADLGVIGGASFGSSSLDLPNTTPGGGLNDDQAQATGAPLTELADTFETADALTIESWINQDSQQTWAKTFMTGTGQDDFITITPAAGNASNRLTAQVQIDNVEIGLDSGVTILDDTDYYVALALDDANDQMSLYVGEVGGELHYTTIAMPQELANLDLTGFSLGSPLFWGGQDWDGQIDEFRIWESALDNGQIAANFAAGPDALPGTAVPEPTTWVLFAVGMLGFVYHRRRKK